MVPFLGGGLETWSWLVTLVCPLSRRRISASLRSFSSSCCCCCLIRAWASRSACSLFRISSFLRSINKAGIFKGDCWAEISSAQSSDMNGPVLDSKNPVRLICILFGSTIGLVGSSNKPFTYSTTTSSSNPSNSIIFSEIHGRITESSTLRISTFWSSSLGKLIDFNKDFSLSLKRVSCSLDVPLKKPASPMV